MTPEQRTQVVRIVASNFTQDVGGLGNGHIAMLDFTAGAERFLDAMSPEDQDACCTWILGQIPDDQWLATCGCYEGKNEETGGEIMSDGEEKNPRRIEVPSVVWQFLNNVFES